MKLLIVAGGGGHFSAAFSVIQKLPKDISVLVVGRKHPFEGDSALSLEYQTCSRNNIPFATVGAGRLQRAFTKHTIASLVKTPFGLAQSLQVLKKFNPDVVLSFGGYVSLPVALGARLFGIPIVVHEQIPAGGLSNKIASFIADRVCISWNESYDFFPREKTVLTGNPIRREISRPPSSVLLDGATEVFLRDQVPFIYITGGSGGSHFLNVLVEEAIPDLTEKYKIIHQTGDSNEYKDFERLSDLKNNLSHQTRHRYIPIRFLDASQIGWILSHASLVVGRCGINTVCELLYWGVPSLLIPLPYAQGNEQEKNALLVKEAGFGEILVQKNVTKTELKKQIHRMISQNNVYKSHAHNGRKKLVLNASENIISVVSAVYEKRKQQEK